MIVCSVCGDGNQRGGAPVCTACGEKLVLSPVLALSSTGPQKSSYRRSPGGHSGGAHSLSTDPGAYAPSSRASWRAGSHAARPVVPFTASSAPAAAVSATIPPTASSFTEPPSVAAGSITTASSTGARRVRRRLVISVAATLGLLILAMLFRGPISSTYADTLDNLNGTTTGAAVCTKGSPSVADHPVGRLVDHRPDQFWSPAKAGGKGTWARCDLLNPGRLVSLRVYNGASPTNERVYHSYGRVKTLAVTVTRSNGKTVTRNVTLKDEIGVQTVSIGVSDAVRVQLTVGSSVGKGQIALGEVAFLVRG